MSELMLNIRFSKIDQTDRSVSLIFYLVSRSADLSCCLTMQLYSAKAVHRWSFILPF